MRRIIAIAAAALVGLPAVAAAQGLIGQCADCHTMHNSEQGQPVALQGTETTASGTANQNLLKMDCIACHASGLSDSSVMPLDGGSKVPQVYHADFENDLAAGNFKHLSDGGDRKGHNIVDLFAADVDNLYAAPGDMRTHNFGPGAGVTGFTCAGAVGCHGTRSQMIGGETKNDGVTAGGNDFWVPVKRQGLAAVSGAHHNSYDGLKDPVQNNVIVVKYGTSLVHNGERVADGYRFIPGLKGKGNVTTTDRWMNKSSLSHNEYYGSTAAFLDTENPAYLGTGCNRCHIPGNPATGGSARMTFNSTLGVPNQSMSGFCITCHGNFHSSGGGDIASNGTSGAFLRHPSDYVLPQDPDKEYLAYEDYDITAPVARPNLAAITDTAKVAAGTDMVMCLSCHQAHATPYDGMLRFDYAEIIAGNTTGDWAGKGCLACHTTKGVSKQN